MAIVPAGLPGGGGCVRMPHPPTGAVGGICGGDTPPPPWGMFHVPPMGGWRGQRRPAEKPAAESVR
jgi:hypothetical protein